MPTSSSRRRSFINVPRILLWAASLVVAAVGFGLMLWSNAKEAAVYTSGTADYPKLFAAQSGSTIGGMLIAVGVFGALLALASLAVTWRPAVVEVEPEADGTPDFEEESAADGEVDAHQQDAPQPASSVTL